MPEAASSPCWAPREPGLDAGGDVPDVRVGAHWRDVGGAVRGALGVDRSTIMKWWRGSSEAGTGRAARVTPSVDAAVASAGLAGLNCAFELADAVVSGREAASLVLASGGSGGRSEERSEVGSARS